MRHEAVSITSVADARILVHRAAGRCVYLIERTQRNEARRTLAGRAPASRYSSRADDLFCPSTGHNFFCRRGFVLNDIALRASFEARYYYWTLSPADFMPLLQRSYRWSNWIKDALSASGLPLDFLYLAAPPSQLSPNTSGARAGFWGLDTAEARKYGLEISTRRDERLDISAVHPPLPLSSARYEVRQAGQRP